MVVVNHIQNDLGIKRSEREIREKFNFPTLDAYIENELSLRHFNESVVAT